MKLPALWILVAFAAGIGIAARWPGSPRVWIVLAALLLFAGVGFACRGFVATAWVCALAAWLALGGFASGVERARIPSNRVVLTFQKTAAYHVLVVAGLHVGALVVFLFWIGSGFWKELEILAA
jgi:hypothetical protein